MKIIHKEVQISQVVSKDPSISELLETPPAPELAADYSQEQRKGEKLADIICFVEEDKLRQDETRAHKIAVQAPLFSVIDGILYYVNPKQGGRRIVVPEHMRAGTMEENHWGPAGAHFYGNRLFRVLSPHWW
ncbi:MAG: hypothetical protein MJE68_13400 [Proteobacteria bacterium]|nr:hypothetical protein [Pseudomonadota bacterium]